MQDPPSLPELLSASRVHLQDHVIPALEDPGLRFRTLVAANVLAIAERELLLGEEQMEAERRRLVSLLGDRGDAKAELAELTRALYQRVSNGNFDEGSARRALMKHLIETTVDKLRITNPKFLERVNLQGED